MKQPQPKLSTRSSARTPSSRRNRRPNAPHRQRDRLSSAVTVVPSKSRQIAQWLSGGLLVLAISIGCGALGFAITRLYNSKIAPSQPIDLRQSRESMPINPSC